MDVSYSFEKGWNKVPIGQSQRIKKKIMDGLKIKSRGSWSNRLRGVVVPSIAEYEYIESVFKEIGILDIWGKADQ